MVNVAAAKQGYACERKIEKFLTKKRVWFNREKDKYRLALPKSPWVHPSKHLEITHNTQFFAVGYAEVAKQKRQRLLSQKEKNTGFKNPEATRSRNVSEPFSACIGLRASCFSKGVRKKLSRFRRSQRTCEKMRNDVGVNEEKLPIENGPRHASLPKIMKSKILTSENVMPTRTTCLAPFQLATLHRQPYQLW